MPTFLSNPITSNSTNIKTKQITCRLFQNVIPSFTPVINNLSVTQSTASEYSLVYVNGLNFLPNGTTYVNFGPYNNIPVTFYSSFYLSFVVPPMATAGNYNVTVVNLYNGQFSKSVKYTYPGNPNYSNYIVYSLI